MMNASSKFLKSEPLILKLLYIVGFLCLTVRITSALINKYVEISSHISLIGNLIILVLFARLVYKRKHLS